MPMVTIEWLAGRTAAQKSELAATITEAVSRVADIDPAGVWVKFEDVAGADWAVGGSLQD